MAYKRQTGAKSSEQKGQGDIPQTQRLPGQIQNDAGGFSFQVNDFNRLARFLILGCEGGSYYASEQKLVRENAECVERLITENEENGLKVVQLATQCSVEGRAAKQEPAIFVLAMCARIGNVETRKAAYASVAKVCRIPTTLFTFLQYTKDMSPEGKGWGRLARHFIGNWYTERDPKDLAFAITKYQNRGGWNHRDVLRVIHPCSKNQATQFLLKYMAKGWEEAEKDIPATPDEKTQEIVKFLRAVEEAKGLKEADEEKMCHLIATHGLVREHIPTVLLNSKLIWETMLKDMPMTATIRNLGKMSTIGILPLGSQNEEIVCQKLDNEANLKRAKIHPFNVLTALLTYNKGKGVKGSLSWEVNHKVAKALEAAFYKSFSTIVPTGLRYLLALDVSGSMCCPCMGSPVVTCREASACMAMVTLRTEANCTVVGFSDHLVPVNLTPQDKLESVVKKIDAIPMGGTDCAAPMQYARANNLPIDVFIVYTDCETFFGKIHPSEAIKKYRRETGIPAKLIVVGMSANKFTIADPNDAGMMDIAGFDSAAPEVMKEFALGNI